MIIALAMVAPASAQNLPDCGLYTYAAKITRVVDGDTVDADVDLGFNVWRHNERLRLDGVDTPERGEPGYDEATEALSRRISGRSVYICTVPAKRSTKEQTGKYGRYLATIWYEGRNINQWLLDEGLGAPYGE